MEQNGIIECAGFYFIHNFDSGNLGHVERVPTDLIVSSQNHKTNTLEKPDYEFNLWTRPDCAGTEFENGNRTWFYFGIQAKEPHVLVRLNLVNLNKQGKMYNQGMAPVTRTLPGRPHWERIRDRPVHSMDDNTFTLSFKYRTSDNLKATTFFAFTYPYSFAELQICLNSIDLKLLSLPTAPAPDDIYYCRECLVYSLEGRRVDLLTISSHHSITTEREVRLKNLFPTTQERPFKFNNKKVIFISARVHPGETPSSFVFNGFLNLILTRSDPVALHLRKLYVFKMIPFLNPDGVARGHYRTDTRGVNLNRVYLNPSLIYHPTVYASRALIRYYHYGCEKEDTFDDCKSYASSLHNILENVEPTVEIKKKKHPFKSGSNKLDKPKSAEVKQVNITVKKDACEGSSITGDALNLAAQVCDMKLQERPSQTSTDSNGNVQASNSVLTDEILKSCLGSSVHLSTSEEMNIQGGNPLRPLRDALKNSISLLMGTNVTTAWEGARPGRCEECQRAAKQFSNAASDVTSATIRPENTTCNSIEEYREQQLHQMELEGKARSKGKQEVCFCTNCFKRYIFGESHEEVEVQPSSDDSKTTEPLEDCHPVSKADEISPTLTPQSKDEKPNAPSNKSSKKKPPAHPPVSAVKNSNKENDSGLFLYIDLHGHASKKGIFMYGNHFEDTEKSVECMLLPRIMALNNVNFHFSSCNFTERNMYLKDRRDGMSREGSGRVAVLKATGLVRSYTLECNYNTGRLVNALPPTAREQQAPPAPHPASAVPPYYTPHIYEEVGRSLGSSILDLTSQHPDSRIPSSEHRSLAVLRDSLRALAKPLRPQLTMSRLRPKTSSPTRLPLYPRKSKITEERKENSYIGTKSDVERKTSPPVLAARLGNQSNSNTKLSKKTEPSKSSSRTRYLADNEPKPKSLMAKRRNVIAIRKPNSNKQIGGVVKMKSKRCSENSDKLVKMSKRSLNRIRGAISRDNRCRAMASSSSEELVGANWENVVGGTVLGSGVDSLTVGGKRRPFPNPSPSRLKKIRLKTSL